jgi:hypothetical protein
MSMNLKNAVENHFTAKPPRAQRTYIKDKNHSFGEAEDRTNVNSKPWISWRLCDLAVEVCIPTAFFRMNCTSHQARTETR